MKVLSHRGYWKDESEKNQVIAFERTFSLGFGTETDLRDFNGELVISHDIANSSCLQASVFFEIYNKHGCTAPLALNIKSDGLQHKLKDMLALFNIENYFVFDMSVPDGLQYLKHSINTYTRESEYESSPSFYEQASGIWLDEFHSHWITEDTIASHNRHGKHMCIVSPDLHKRDYMEEWASYKQIEKKLGINNLMICTDFPETAEEFFND